MRPALVFCALAFAGCAAVPVPPAPPAPAIGWIAVSANDNKAVLDNGNLKVLEHPQPDTVAVIDLHGPQPRVLAEIEAPATVVGPPLSVAVAPDESYALVTSGKRRLNDQLVSDNLLSVIDLKASPPVLRRTLYVGAGAAGVSINKAGDLALVANRDEGTVSVVALDHGTVEVVDKLPLGNAQAGPSHVVFTPDGRTALVTRDGDHRITLLKIEGRKVALAQRDVYAGLKPYPIDVCAPGAVAVVGNVGMAQGDEDTVSVIDLQAQPPRVVETVTVGQTPEGLICSPDGRYVAVTAMSGSNKAPSSPFYRPHGRVVVFRLEGRHLVKHGEADDGNWSQGVVFSPDSRTLLVQNMVQKALQVLRVDASGISDTGVQLPLKAGPAGIRAATP